MALGKSSAIEVSGGSEKWHTDTVTLAEQVLEALAGELRGTAPVTHAVIVKDPAKALCEEAARLDASNDRRRQQAGAGSRAGARLDRQRRCQTSTLQRLDRPHHLSIRNRLSISESHPKRASGAHAAARVES